MRSYENSGYNPYNDNYRSESRGSARNYYSDENDLTKRRMRTSSSAHGKDTLGGFGAGRDVHNTSGYGGTSTYGRSAGNWDNSKQNNSSSSWRNNDRNERDGWDRAGDEVKSWFGDDDAERRRRMDDRRDNESDRYSSRGSSNNYRSSDYGRSNYGGSNYGSSYDNNNSSSNWRNNDRNERDGWDRAGDEVKSWFGDDDAERRRRMDDRRDNESDRYNRGSYNTSFGTGASSYSGSYGSDNDSNDRDGLGFRRNSNAGSNYGSSSNYGRSNYGSTGSSSDWSNDYNSGSNRSWNRDHDNDHERGFWDRAGDEVKSWFGDEEAERRRRMDEMNDGNDDYRGNQRSSSNYTGRTTYDGPPYSYGSSSRRDYEW
ncbi:SWFGD domain-containing protein [Pontibacter sp. SGAir0037]|uniref:SWFGD domain-containing protein n=1 Tax=Pontibacter sp. SGAir0037 TaxID=2571030 RepID=UPI0010CCFE71|nr:SWFGD domain-containing protein [Pontibacter sp. SGAir0037]QCR23138.1 SWFGD domain-containing protein [Pontibacter sp. SGAir0037]